MQEHNQMNFFSNGVRSIWDNMTIQNYIEKQYPTHYKSGKWGCCLVGIDYTTIKQLKKEYPHGFQVSIGPKKEYWVWLNND